MKLMYDKENRIYLTLIGLFCLGLIVSCIVAVSYTHLTLPTT